MQRHIVHIDMDAFFVSVERLRDPSLVGRPVVVGSSEGRGVVASASYEARRYGIRSAMPGAVARRLCPQAVFVRGSHGLYSKISREVRRVFEAWTPLVEMTSIDEAYLDLTGFDRCYGPVLGTVDRIVHQVRATFGLDLSAGIAANKLVAKIAAKSAKPSGVMMVLPGREEAFMARLGLPEVPGVGDSLAGRLEAMGLRTVGDLQKLDRDPLVRAFGVTGDWLYRMARGRGGLEIDPERQPAKSVGHSVTFNQDTVDRRFLEAVLYRLSEKVGARVREKGLVGRTVTLRLRYSDFRTLTRAGSAGAGTDCDAEIYERAGRLMEPLLERRVRVRLLGVTLAGLRPADGQYDMFALERQQHAFRFYRTVDSVRGKYGFDSLKKGPGLWLTGLRSPDEYDRRKAG